MQDEVIGLIIAVNIVLVLLVGGIVMFVIQYKRKKSEHEKEKNLIGEAHQLELLNMKLDTQQQTMQHIGQEIHDNVGQKLTLASLYSKQLSIQDTGGSKEKIQSISTILDESLRELRQLSKSLTNPELLTADISTLLRDEAARITAAGTCFVKVESNNDWPDLPLADKSILFRILQEFMQNSLKHAECRNITISLKRTEQQLTITAADNGKGFDMVAVSDGIGLQNMKRRASQIGASFSLNSQTGKGTSLTLALTLKE